MPSLYKILHYEDVIVCNHGGTVDLVPVVERDSEYNADKRIVTNVDLTDNVTISGCSQQCTKVASIQKGMAKQFVLRGDTIPILGNLQATSDKGCRVTWKGSLASALGEDEGRRTDAYQNWMPKDKKYDALTIGIGHNVEAHPVDGVHKVGDKISEDRIDELFEQDMTRAENSAKGAMNTADPSVEDPLKWDDLTGEQQEAMTNLAFNMGSFGGWPKFMTAMRSGDFTEAARQLSVGDDGTSPSHWIQQVQASRSSRILEQILGNDKGTESYAAPE